MMLLEGLVIQLLVVLLLGGLSKGRIKDLLFDLCVNLELPLDRLQELFARVHRSGRGLLELAEERADFLWSSLSRVIASFSAARVFDLGMDSPPVAGFVTVCESKQHA